MREQIKTISESVKLLKQLGDQLADPVPVPGMPPMTFSCSFAPSGATQAELSELSFACPSDVAEFWELARTARLFEDQQYGQWGLELVDPKQAAELSRKCKTKRPRDFTAGDMVLGRFLGDSDLLVIRCDPNAQDFGQALVALPLDPRAEWYVASESFAAFLDDYVETGGEKFWVTR